MTIEIRKAGPEDAIALSGLCAEHAAFEKGAFNPKDHAERLAALLGNEENQLTIFIAIDDGKILGFVSVTKDISTWAAKPFLHMDCLYVVEAARGTGIGKSLFEAVKALAIELGVSEVQWQTPDWNTSAIQFYNGLGANSSSKIRFTMCL